MIFLDSNIIIRFILGDDPMLSPKARDILGKIEKGEVEVYMPAVVIAEIVYVFLKVYKLNRQEISQKLLPLLMLDGIFIEDKIIYKAAFEYFISKNIDFEDALQVALMHKKKVKQIYSFDKDFDKFTDIERLEE